MRRWQPFVKDLKDDEAAALAAHFAKLPPKTSGESIDPVLAKRGNDAIRCSGVAARATCRRSQASSKSRGLAKQRMDYLIQSLKEFRDGTRLGADTNMSVPVVGLSDADLAALAHYAASL